MKRMFFARLENSIKWDAFPNRKRIIRVAVVEVILRFFYEPKNAHHESPEETENDEDPEISQMLEKHPAVSPG
jgi:hypothetical protein